MTFEEAFEKYLEISKKLEGGNLSLDESTKLYEEGIIVLKQCHAALEKSKGKVTELKKEVDKLVEVPFEENEE